MVCGLVPPSQIPMAQRLGVFDLPESVEGLYFEDLPPDSYIGVSEVTCPVGGTLLAEHRVLTLSSDAAIVSRSHLFELQVSPAHLGV